MPSLLRHFASLPASFFSVSQWMRCSKLDLLLPFYHVVSDEYLPHISPLYRYKTKREFIEDLETLLKYYHPVSLSEVYQKRQNNEKFTRPSFFLSFDDGLREIGEIVAPILLKKGIPATFFVNPDFVNNRRLFFRYKAALLIDKLKSTNLPSQFEFLGTHKSKSGWQDWAMAAKYDQEENLDQLALLLDVSFDDFLIKKRPYLDLEELHALKSQGFDIGGHSLNHPEYRFITTEEQVSQTVESLRWVQKNGLESVSCFAFPFTDYGVTRETLDKMNKQATTLLFGTAGIKIEKNPMHLQRLPIENTFTGLEKLICTELLLYALKKRIGKETVDRK